MDPQRVSHLRDNIYEHGSLALVLYLDLPDEDATRRMEDGLATVMALNRRLSSAILALLKTSGDNDGCGLRDEAARALDLFLACVVDRQALFVQAIEGLYNTRPVSSGEPDYWKGLNKRESYWRKRIRRALRRELAQYPDNDTEEQNGEDEPPAPLELDAEAVMEECERFLFGDGDAA